MAGRHSLRVRDSLGRGLAPSPAALSLGHRDPTRCYGPDRCRVGGLYSEFALNEVDDLGHKRDAADDEEPAETGEVAGAALGDSAAGECRHRGLPLGEPRHGRSR